MRAESKREGPLRPKPRNALLALLLALGSSGTMAQNLVQNGAFDSSVDSWFFSGVSFISWMWSAAGAPGGAPGSGSAEVRYQAAGTGAPVAGLVQCVNVSEASSDFSYAALARTALEGESQVLAWVQFQSYFGADCSDFTGAPRQSFVVNTGDEIWRSASGSFTLEPGVRSVEVILAIEKPLGSGENGAAYFDNISLSQPALADASLRRWTIDAGGGRAAGGGIVLSGSIGQPEPGSAAGGSISLQSGFWFAAGAAPPPSGELIFRNSFE